MRQITRWAPHAGAGLLAVLGAACILHWPSLFRLIDITGDNVITSAFCKTIADVGWYTTNPFMGAPGSMDLLQVPITDNAHFLGLKMLTSLGLSAVTAVNCYFWLTFMLAAALASWVLQRLGAGAWSAMICGCGYALLPYHFMRGTAHLFLGGYFMVPVAVLALLSSVRWEGPIRPIRQRWCWGIALALPAFGVYYALFYAYLLAAALGLQALAERRLQPLRRGVGMAGAVLVGMGLNLLPSIINRLQHSDHGRMTRSWTEADRYALRLVQMLVPPPGHRWEPLRRLSELYAQAAPPINENVTACLGLVGSVVFVGVMGSSLVLLGARAVPKGERLAGVRGIFALNLLCILYGTEGGLGTLVAFYLNPILRSNNRIVVFIAFFTLMAAIYLGQVAMERLPGKGWQWGANAALALLLGAMICDLRDVDFFPNWRVAAAAQVEDAEFAARLQEHVPAGTRIYQLPYVKFPEAGLGDADYHHLRLYLHTQGIHFSFGAIHGTATDGWNQATASLLYRDGAAFADMLRQQGFAGVVVARGIPTADAPQVEQALRGALGPAALESAAGNYVYFPLPAPGSTS